MLEKKGQVISSRRQFYRLRSHGKNSSLIKGSFMTSSNLRVPVNKNGK